MKVHTLLFLVVVLAACLTQFGADIYAPSLPAISEQMQVNIGLVQWSMSIYMLGIALSQLVFGPLSEGIGRKMPLLLGMLIMLGGSLLCLFSTNVHMLITGRLIQGLGAGAAAALWRTIFRDLYQGDELAKYTSYLVILIMFIVPAAPALGGYLQHYLNWQASFGFMVVYGVVVICAIQWGYKETSQHHHLERLKPSFIVRTYLQMLTSPVFMGITMCTFLSYGAFFSWLVVGPVLLIKVVGLSPVVYGWITLLGGGIAYGLAGTINGKVVTRFGASNMIRFGWSVMIFSSILFFLGQIFIGTTALTLVIPMLFLYFGGTFIWPNVYAMAFTPFGKVAGYAGALYGAMQLGGGAALGGVISYLPDHNPIPLAWIILIASSASWLIYERVVPKH
ncbi:MAG: Bicyclomycin resistance protein [Chlamydiales bacterium]|nr:Bicyclomycin resistance protein [Chlamydiales bacterium]